ncbi:hypothetical protein Tco_1083196, partial [Tanacetum coccineum]
VTPIIRKIHGRPKKNRVKAHGKNNSQVSSLGKQIRGSNCQGVGHNKASYENETVPKPLIVKKVPGRRREPIVQNALARGGGRGSRGGGRGAMDGPGGAKSGGSGAMGGSGGAESDGKPTIGGGRGADSGGIATMGSGRGRKGGGRGRKGGGRESTSGSLMDEEDIRQSMEHEYLQGLLDEKEDQRQKEEK